MRFIFVTGKINLLYLLTGKLDNVLLGSLLLWFTLHSPSGRLLLKQLHQCK